jgi:hypothetical protein
MEASMLAIGGMKAASTERKQKVPARIEANNHPSVQASSIAASKNIQATVEQPKRNIKLSKQLSHQLCCFADIWSAAHSLMGEDLHVFFAQVIAHVGAKVDVLAPFVLRSSCWR